MSSADYLDEWFETEALKATKSASGIIGTLLGPRSPGTAYVLLHHYMGEIDGVFRAWGFAKGGNGSVSAAIAARGAGGRRRDPHQAPVARVLVANGRATGVALEKRRRARSRARSLERRPAAHLPGSRRCRASARRPDRGHRALQVPRGLREGESGVGRAAGFHVPAGRRARICRGAISISPSVEYLERAYDDAKYGEFSRRPYMDIIMPSMIDPAMAPPGKHVMSIFAQYAPYRLNGGWTDARREAFGDAVIDTLSQYAPNLKSAILHRQVITPADIESTIGLTEGNIFQGELTLSQMFFLRPAPAWAKYRTPIHGLYQCGAGTHPGGGVMGAPGRNAAFAILRPGA